MINILPTAHFARKQRKVTALLLLLALVYLPLSGAVSHYCFDGNEPPVSIHFDNFSGHVEHEEEIDHLDLEKPVLDDHLIGKYIDQDPALPGSLFGLETFRHQATSTPAAPAVSLHVAGLWHLTPPLRAPPQLA